MKKNKYTFLLLTLVLFCVYGGLSATTISEPKLKVESGKMLFTLVKTNSSGYDPSMTDSAKMTGMANQTSGSVNMKEKTFDVTMDVSLNSFFLGGKFKFANGRMHETHLESFNFASMNYKGNIESYDNSTGKAKLTGKMSAHGITKDNFAIEGKITPSKSGNGYLFASDFKVNLKDFKIEVPKTKLTKVSPIVKVKIKLELREEK